MEQNNHNSPKDKDTGPDSIEWLTKWRDNLPSNRTRYIMIVGFSLLILLVVYLGYARGGLDICNSLGGRFEAGIEIKCHPGYSNNPPSCIDTLGRLLTLPEFDNAIK